MEEAQLSAAEDKFDFLELLLVLARRKAFILRVTLAAAVIAAVVSLILPSLYTATTTILPPQQNQSVLNSMLGQLGALTGFNESDLGLRNPLDIFIAMLQSRRVEDRLIDRFDLRNQYRVKRYQDARKKLEARSDIFADKQGLISVSVTDHDPQRAAEMANAYVEELHTLNSELAVGEAGQRRLFYQQRIDAEREALSQAEVALRQVQEKSGLVQPDAQGKAIIESLADMQAKVAAKEVQLDAMRTYATENNPDVKRAEQELGGLRAELAKMQRNTGQSGEGNLEVPTRQLPAAALEYIRRARDVKYHEALFEFLIKQLEAARLDEGKDALVVQTVDKAVPPERRSSPRRTLMVLIAALAAFLLACLWVLIAAAWRRKEQDPQERARLALLRHSLRFGTHQE